MKSTQCLKALIKLFSGLGGDVDGLFKKSQREDKAETMFYYIADICRSNGTYLLRPLKISQIEDGFSGENVYRDLLS